MDSCGALSTDAKLKAKARKQAQDRLKTTQEASKTTTRPTAATTTTPQVDPTAALRLQIEAEIDAEYGAVIAQAVETITALQDQIVALKTALINANLTDQGRRDAAAA